MKERGGAQTLISFLLLLNCFYQGQCLVCLNCDNVFQPHTCKHVTECFKDEMCGTQTYISAYGEVKHKLGCVDKNTCNQYSPPTVGHGFQACKHCCDTGNLCNAVGCNSTGFPRQRGPICYSCENLPAGMPCHQIQFCEAHEVCYNEATLEFQSDTLYSSGCRSKHNCAITQPAVGKRDIDSGSRALVADAKSRDVVSRSVSVCTDCCSGDLCNTNCQKRDACADDSTCQLLLQNYDVCRIPDVARKFCKKSCNLCGTNHTCNDSTKNCSYQANLVRNMCGSFQTASSSGCLKYCGFCSATIPSLRKTTTPFWTSTTTPFLTKTWTATTTRYQSTWSHNTTNRSQTTRATAYNKTASPTPTRALPFSITSYAPVIHSLGIGDLVVRGADWKWGDQDHNSTGTIIGNGTTPGWVKVKWNYDGYTDSYRMGAENSTDLILYTRPSTSTTTASIQPTTTVLSVNFTIGETVCRGPDWQWGDQDHGKPGTVIAFDGGPGWVRIRWSADGQDNVYRIGAQNGAMDVIACANMTTTVTKISTTTTSPSSPTPTRALPFSITSYAPVIHSLGIGDLVVRGPDWKWGDQDHNSTGTIIGNGTTPGWVKVKWNYDGYTDSYRLGAENSTDLILYTRPSTSTTTASIQPTTTVLSVNFTIGETVCRGPDWQWGDQDHGKPGTVVAFDGGPGWVRIRWSADGQDNVYRIGAQNGAMDVIACTSMTTTVTKISTTTTSPLPTGGAQLAALLHVGLRVVRGKDWKWDIQDHFGKGTVTNVGSDGWVTVKWDSDGLKNTYRMGAEKAYDLMITT